MLPRKKLAIATRLHVLLRRKTGRVTDTEWLAANAEACADTPAPRAPVMTDSADRSTDVARFRPRLR